MAMDLLGLLAVACPQIYYQGRFRCMAIAAACHPSHLISFLHLSNAPSRSFNSSACEMQANGSSISVLCFDLNSMTSIFFYFFQLALQSDPPPLIEGRRRGRRGAEKNVGKRRTQSRARRTPRRRTPSSTRRGTSPSSLHRTTPPRRHHPEWVPLHRGRRRAERGKSRGDQVAEEDAPREHHHAGA